MPVIISVKELNIYNDHRKYNYVGIQIKRKETKTFYV